MIVACVALFAVLAWLIFVFGFLGADPDRMLVPNSQFGVSELLLTPVLVVLFASTIVIFPIGIILVGWWFVRTCMEVRKDLPVWQRLLFGPHLPFSDRYLTPVGAEYRVRFMGALRFLGVGVILALLVFAIGLPLGIVQGAS